MIEVKTFESMENKAYWLEKIKQSDWGAGQFLYQLLSEDRLRKLCGETTEVLLAVNGETLLAFCTYAEMDDVQPTDLTPWAGFVYTYPEHRGNKYAGLVLKKAEAEETTKVGIILTGSAKEKPDMSEVVAVGPGGVIDGKEVKMVLNVGDRVIVGKYSGTEVKLDGVEYTVVSQSDILAVVE